MDAGRLWCAGSPGLRLPGQQRRAASLALGEDRQVELLHMDLAKADELLKEGALPEAVVSPLKLACRGAEGGVKRTVLLSRKEPHALLREALGQRVMGLSVTP